MYNNLAQKQFLQSDMQLVNYIHAIYSEKSISSKQKTPELIDLDITF